MANNMNRCSARFASDACISIYVFEIELSRQNNGYATWENGTV